MQHMRCCLLVVQQQQLLLQRWQQQQAAAGAAVASHHLQCADTAVAHACMPRTRARVRPQVCAYTLPCWFALRLFGSRMSRPEVWLCHAIIPLSLLVSAAGLVSSVSTLIQDIKAGGSGFGPPV